MKMFPAILAGVILSFSAGQCVAQTQQSCEAAPSEAYPDIPPQMVWVDTDIGDDIDDAFALGLVLRSPELQLLGISTAFGETETRANLVDRFLGSLQNRSLLSIPVTAGVHTKTDNVMTQVAYARLQPGHKHADGVEALLKQIRLHPYKITLLAIGPLFNIAAAIDKDPKTFKKLCRVVMMGGSINRGYDGPNGEHRPPDAEWNINRDPAGAAKLFASGVQIYVLPLDSTQIHLEAAERTVLFSEGDPMTDQISLLYNQWVAHTANHSPTPTLFDPLAAAFTFRPELCPSTAMHIEVDSKGFTNRTAGVPNAEVCLKSDEDNFLLLLAGRLEGRELKGFVRSAKGFTEIR